MTKQKTCNGCCGTGVQKNENGLNVRCPICRGSGVMVVPSSPRDNRVMWIS